MRLVGVRHPQTFREGFKSRQREPFNLLVDPREEVVVKDVVHLLRTNWPLNHPHFILDVGEEFQVGAFPTTCHMIQQSILGPSSLILG